MTFGTYESSLALGCPIGLYRFTRGPASWYFTSADRDFTSVGSGDTSITWTAIPIKSSGFTQSGSKQDDSFSLSMPASSVIGQMFVGTPPTTRLLLRYYEIHEEDPDQQMIMQWCGPVQTMDFATVGEVKIKAVSLMAKLGTDGVRCAFGRECSFALYDPNTCRVNKATYATPVVLTGVSVNGLIGAGFASRADGRFANGFVEWTTTDGFTNALSLSQHTGDSVTTMGFTNGLEIGMSITAYPGCARNDQDCRDFYNNLDNHGALSQMSGRSVFDGDPVF